MCLKEKKMRDMNKKHYRESLDFKQLMWWTDNKFYSMSIQRKMKKI